MTWRDCGKRCIHFLVLALELAACAVIAAMLADMLPAPPGLIVWGLGVVACFAAAMAFGLPRPARASLHGALWTGAIIFTLPFLWLLSSSFKQPQETFLFPPRWVPAVAKAPVQSPWIDPGGQERELILEELRLHLSDDSEHVVPVQWSAVGPATIRCAGDACAVHYDFASSDAIHVIGRFRAEQPFDSVTLRFQQDDSWHRIRFQLQSGGRSWTSDDPLYLGAKSSLEWTFSTVPTRPQERFLGIWPLKLSSSSADPTDTVLDIEVDQSSPFRATLAKWTQSFRDAWYADANWPRYFANSALLVVLNIVGQTLACSMAAFALSRLKWAGRELTFGIILATMMLPGVVVIVPQFLVFKSFGWYNTLLPLWTPAFAGGAFFIFMLRQFMLSIPRDIEDAARIDGCSWFGVYWRIIIPSIHPALAAVAVFTFMGTWNEFMGPLIYLGDQRLFPLSLGLYNFGSEHGTEINMLMAASTLLALPAVVVFFIAQRYLVESVTVAGIK